MSHELSPPSLKPLECILTFHCQKTLLAAAPRLLHYSELSRGREGDIRCFLFFLWLLTHISFFYSFSFLHSVKLEKGQYISHHKWINNTVRLTVLVFNQKCWWKAPISADFSWFREEGLMKSVIDIKHVHFRELKPDCELEWGDSALFRYKSC